MWSDDIDKKIQDGAGSHEPPFREDDWDRMHALLDKHLPQEKKKRPFIWSFLLFLLVGIPATVMLTTYKSRPENPAVAQTATDRSSSTDGTKATPSTSAGKNTEEDQPAERSGRISQDRLVTTGSEQVSSNSSKTPVQKKDKHITTANTGNTVKQQNSPSKTRERSGPVIKQRNDHSTQESSSATELVNNKVHPPETSGGGITSTEITLSTGEEQSVDPSKNTPVETKDSIPAEAPLTKKEKNPAASKSGKWQISLSTGPDLSMVGVEKTGKWKMQYGVGISYAFSNRLQVRSGFMISRKLYYADSSDYHPPKGFWNYYTNLQKIDANCLVYEIPLNIVYTFPSQKKHQWFVSTGLSSYLMKKETYEYYYKDAWGVPMYRERSVQNENDHLFSILQLSGGYQYKFSDRLSLMAEPYVKLPLGGVGFGKVKLNNTGVLFSIGFKPFVKNK